LPCYRSSPRSDARFQGAAERRAPKQPGRAEIVTILKATVKATPVDAYGRDSTIQHVGLAGHVQNNPGWTSTDALKRKFLELQNR